MFEFGASDNELPEWKTTRHKALLCCRRILSEMNKCLTLVHLTCAFRIHSGVPGDSKARNLWPHDQLLTALLDCL
jgi:hypothetical protein